MKLSNRVLDLSFSPIRKLSDKAKIVLDSGISIYHLNIGQPDIKTPEVALDAIRNYNQKTVEYSHSAGNSTYREKLSKYYETKNININADEIIVGWTITQEQRKIDDIRKDYDE